MDLYFKRHDGQAVTCDDFRNAMADANKKDLTSFAAWCVSPHLKPMVVGIPSLLCGLAWQRGTKQGASCLPPGWETPGAAAQNLFKGHRPWLIPG